MSKDKRFFVKWTMVLTAILSTVGVILSEALQIIWENKKLLLKQAIMAALAATLFIVGWKYVVSPMLPWGAPMTRHESLRMFVLRDTCYHLNFARSIRYQLGLIGEKHPDIKIEITPFFDEMDALYQKRCADRG